MTEQSHGFSFSSAGSTDIQSKAMVNPTIIMGGNNYRHGVLSKILSNRIPIRVRELFYFVLKQLW